MSLFFQYGSETFSFQFDIFCFHYNTYTTVSKME